jgi:hypothetical protein
MTPPPNACPSPWTTCATPGVGQILGQGEAAAMFLDLENIVSGAGTGDGSCLDETALAGLCRGLGTPNRVRRAYANWSDHRLHRYEPVLARNGVDLIQCGSLTRAAKNAADIRLVVDAMHILHTYPGIDTYVLATGDSDFSPLVNHLRERGKIVIGVGARTTASPHLAGLCTTYLYWPTPAPPTAPEPPHDPAPSLPLPSVPRPAPTALSQRQAHRLLIRVLRQRPDDDPTGAVVNSAMRQIDPTFHHTALGFARFRDFLASCPRVSITTHPGTDLTVSLASGRTDVTTPTTSPGDGNST